MPVSACIIAFNEADKIEAAVNSVLWADEVVVVDSGSTDGTAGRATSLGARVVQVPFEGFGRLRNAALGHLSHEWIFSLDSDERCTPEARDEILRITADPASPPVWLVPRRNWFLGRWIRHSGWYPDFRQPQLFRRGSMAYTEDPVHEGFILLQSAPLARMRSAIWQVPFKNLAEALHKANRYSSLGAEKLHARGKRGSMPKAISHGLVAFFRHYIVKLGFLDGWAGFAIAFSNLEGTFWRYAKLTELDGRYPKPPPSPPLGRPPAGSSASS
jgi:glycosyltransferase involved in cell wall biosynthesis